MEFSRDLTRQRVGLPRATVSNFYKMNAFRTKQLRSAAKGNLAKWRKQHPHPPTNLRVWFVLEDITLAPGLSAFSHAFIIIDTTSIHLQIDFEKDCVEVDIQENEILRPNARIIDQGTTSLSAGECICIGDFSLLLSNKNSQSSYYYV
jgi:hypothetical protein